MFPLYLDEDSSERALVAALRGAGFDCLTVLEAQRTRFSDEDQLAFAAEEGRVIYTRNTRDFRRLDALWHQAGRSHAGIIVLSIQQTPVGVQLRALTKVAAAFESGDMVDRLVFLRNYI